ncbi:hypothetical protein [Niallia sp. NCCP-28]|uniref:hypothetical protein n=1 Tax=Niallia sp. NCCP-28 TaxID=2934712 RepID=UPI0020883B41|nr:hypothetical protein [Niallia sp. NCCP-28]GKU80912.1 hypothetical protein NCCP28_03080 [Niallia sp. NCCP-28]
MFDPTAFENIKTVMEGAIYDKDLEGTIAILDRNDIFNSSKLAREYSISFALKNQGNALMTFRLLANAQNLAGELLEIKSLQEEVGCTIAVEIVVKHANDSSVYAMLKELLKNIWGKKREIKQEIRLNPYACDNMVENHLSIAFNRLITEDQMDDLVVMVDYMEKTLQLIADNKMFYSL